MPETDDEESVLGDDELLELSRPIEPTNDAADDLTVGRDDDESGAENPPPDGDSDSTGIPRSTWREAGQYEKLLLATKAAPTQPTTDILDVEC